jgi:hypothetical protein
MPQQDPIFSQAAQANPLGPFASVIQSGLVPGTQPQEASQPASGFFNKGQGAAYIGVELLKGIRRGKMLSYIAEEAKRVQTYNTGVQQYESKIAAAHEAGDTERVQYFQKKLSEWIGGHGQLELAGDEKKAKSKRTYSAEERPSIGGKLTQGPGSERSYSGGTPTQGQASKKSVQASGPGEHVRGLVGSIFEHISGPNLPHSGKLDLGTVYQNIAEGSNLPDQATRAKEAHSQVDQIIAKYSAIEGATQRQVFASPEFSKIFQSDQWKYIAPQTRADIMTRLSNAFPDPKEALAEQQQKEVIENLKDARTEDSPPTSREAGPGSPPATAPPDARTIREQGLPPYADQAAPRSVSLIPEGQKTPQMRVADRYNPPGLDAYLGKPWVPSPYLKLPASGIGVVWLKKGDQVLAFTDWGIAVTEAGTHRKLNVNAAKADGWEVSSERPVRPQHLTNPLKGVEWDPKKKLFYAKQYNPETKAWERSKNSDGTDLIARPAPQEANLLMQGARMFDGMQRQRDANEKQLTSEARKDIADIRNEVGKYKVNVGMGEKPRKPEDITEMIRVRTQELADSIAKNKADFRERSNNLGRMTQMQQFANQMNQEPPEEAEQAQQPFDPGTGGEFIFGKGK